MGEKRYNSRTAVVNFTTWSSLTPFNTTSSKSSLIYYFAIFNLLFALTYSLETTPSSNTTNSTSCGCGVDQVPCGKSMTAKDCPNGRIIGRKDCPCCYVCAKQLTEECGGEFLCDEEFGLECGPEKKCRARISCTDDTSCSNDQLCFGGACAEVCKVMVDTCLESNMTGGICIARNHRAQCTCPPGSIMDSERKECTKEKMEMITGSQGIENSEKMTEVPETTEKAPEISERMDKTSETVLKQDNNTVEHSTSERSSTEISAPTQTPQTPESSVNTTASSEHVSKTPEIQEVSSTTPVPSTTSSTTVTPTPEVETTPATILLEESSPTTIQSLLEPHESSSGPSVSIGCMHNSSSYEIGEIFFIGCDERCECLPNGEIKCIERCTIPLFKKGSFSHDKLCFEEPSGIDECCVFIACAKSNLKHEGKNNTGRNEESGREIVALVPTSSPSSEEGLMKDPCASVKCGGNAHCLASPGAIPLTSSEEMNQTLCVCDEGFVGDPYDLKEEQGCQPNVPSPSTEPSSSSSTSTASIKEPPTGCLHKNKTYSFGDEALDDCNYKCKCEPSGEFLCVPRCSYRPNQHSDEEDKISIPPGCVIKKDPIDECCEMLVCEDHNTERIPTPTASSSEGGCTYKNKTYAKEEKFYDGCDHQCMCYSNGDVTCQPRCPPATSSNSSSLNDCVTLPDPTDPECCMVTLCNSNSNKTVGEIEDVKKDEEHVHHVHLPAKGESRSKKLEDEDKHKKIDEILGKHNEKKPSIEKSEKSKKIEHDKLFSKEAKTSAEDSVSEEDTNSEADDEDNDASSLPHLPCTYRDKTYTYGQEFYDSCDSYCTCRGNGKMRCVKIECPNDGLDLLDDACLKWEADPSFKKVPPTCCPKMICVEHSTCKLDGGLVIKNFDEVPQKISGCDKRCYCEFGKVSCQNICPPVDEVPPPKLACPKELAVVTKMKENECCFEWTCRPMEHHSGENLNQSLLHAFNNTNTISSTPPTLQVNLSSTPDPMAPTPPTLIHLPPNKLLSAHHLQQLLQEIKNLGLNEHEPEHENPTTSEERDPEGTFVQVQTPQQVQELQRELGARLVEQAEDGSFILFVPGGKATEEELEEDQSFSSGPPFLHVLPPTGGSSNSANKPNAGTSQFPHYGIPNPFQLPTHGGLPMLPPGAQHPHHPPHGHDRTKVANVVIHSLNESTLQIDFTISPILVGLQGHVEVFFTSEIERKPDLAQWSRKVFQQAEDLIDNTHLQLFLTALKPDTEYHILIKVVTVQSEIGSTSEIMRARTLPRKEPLIPTTTLPPEIIVDPELQLKSSSSNSVKLIWRKFADLEKNLVDGVQLAYKAGNDKVYSTTPMLHRSLTSYELEGLVPDTEYEVKLLFIPFSTNQSTILHSDKPIYVRTSVMEDNYAFDLAVKVGKKVGETSVELEIEGVPYPEDKYVNIYQVTYYMTENGSKEHKEYFKVPKRETNKKATLTDLRPGTNYTLWVDAFLSNGKKRRSNVISIQTKAGQLKPETTRQDNLQAASSNLIPSPSSSSKSDPPSYYGALVGLAVVATLSIIGVIALLMILIKKQNYAKAPINDRKSESSYDNPSFKSYDVEANGNGHSHGNKPPPSSEL